MGGKGGSSDWKQRREERLRVELEELEEKIQQRGFLDGLVLRMRRDSSKQSELEQGLQAAADEKFQGLRKWKFVFEDLRSWSIQSVPAAEAAAQVDSGRAVLLDVREGSKFAQGCATGSVNVPLYTSGIKGTTGWDKLRKVAFAGFAMEGTERNPDFLDEVAAAVRSSASQGAAAKKKGGLFSGFAKGPAQPKILVMCQTGGSLETSDERIAKGLRPAVYGDYGNASRSLMAIHDLYEAGFTNLGHVEGGFAQWKYQKLPVDAP